MSEDDISDHRELKRLNREQDVLAYILTAYILLQYIEYTLEASCSSQLSSPFLGGFFFSLFF